MNIRKNMLQANKGFSCKKCRKKVGPAEGTSRNHCPFCLYSLHVDSEVPGDRLSECHGLMAPIGIENNHKKGIRIRHLCQLCGKDMYNRLAPDDNWGLICELSRVPLDPR